LRLNVPPARRTLIAVIGIILLLIYGYAYAAIAVVVVFFVSWLFFPSKQPQDFCAGVIPAIEVLSDYQQTLIDKFNEPERIATDELQQVEKEILNSIYSSKSHYPTWVYHSGFSPGLRSGFRYFLIHLEHAADICCSINYWLLHYDEIEIKGELANFLSESIKINIELLSGLARTMHHYAEKTLRPANDMNADLVSDITALEGALQRVVPGSLELLDMSDEYIFLTAVVRDVKDFREVLLSLIAAAAQKE